MILKKKTIILLLFLIILLPLVFPLFTSYVPGTADGLAHKFRLYSFKKTLAEGIWRPRWIADQALGFGSPIFLFNYLLPYYVTSAISYLGFSINGSTQIFEALTLIFSFLGMYLLTTKLWGRKAGIVASTVYTWAPYHLMSIYLYESWGEMTAFVFPPLILYLILKINSKHEVRNSKQYLNPNDPKYKQFGIWNFGNWNLFRISNLEFRICYFLLVLSWFLFILSHNVSVLMFSPLLLLLGFILVQNEVEPRFGLWRSAFFLINSFILAVLISAFFWLPAITLNQYIAYPQLIAKEMAMRGSYFKSLTTLTQVSLATITKGVTDYYDFTLGLPILVVIILSGWWLFKKLIRVRQVKSIVFKKEGLVLFLIIFLLGSLYLANWASDFIWNLPVLRLVVYPYRFLFLATFTGSVLAGWLVRKHTLLALIFIVLAVLYGRPYTNPYVEIFPFDDDYFSQPQTVFAPPGTRKNMATTEFLPRWADLSFLRQEEERYFVSGKLPEKFVLSPENGKITNSKIGVEKIEAEFDITETTFLTINTFYFPNWRAFLDSREITLSKDVNGRIMAQLPEGKHKLKLMFDTTIVERGAYLTSLLGGVILLVEVIYLTKCPDRHKILNG